MRRSNHHPSAKSHTLPSSPTHSSSSSSDFEFTVVSLSPRKSSAADELFYKGQLLPLHPSPRLSMVRSLLLSSASTSSSSDTTTTASRDSTASRSSSDSSSADLLRNLYCDSSRPSSAAAADFLPPPRKASRYFSLPKLSAVFRKETAGKAAIPLPPPSAVRRVGSTAKEVIRRYLKKVKPLYEKLSQKQPQHPKAPPRVSRSANNTLFLDSRGNDAVSQSFSGNLRYPMRRSCVSSCPSSPRRGEIGFGLRKEGRVGPDSSMEELQSAIQGAIMHCKNSMMTKNKITVNK